LNFSGYIVFPVVFVGTKIDGFGGKREVTLEEVEGGMSLSAVGRNASVFLYQEVSARSREGIDDAYCKMLYSIAYDTKFAKEKLGPVLTSANALATLEEKRREA